MKHGPFVLGLAVLLLTGIAGTPGCSSKKTEAAKIAAWERYQDPYEKIGFSYPQGWTLLADAGKFSVYNDSEAVEKFFDPKSDKKEGVQLIVGRERLDVLVPLDQYIETFQSEKKQSGWQVRAVEAKKIDGLDAKSVTYSGAYDAKTKIKTTRVVTIRDSILFYVEYSAFNDLFEPNQVVLDTALATLRLPRPKSKEELANPALPSSEFDRFDNFALTMTYPQNFDPSTPKPKGEVQFDLILKGMRQDCEIRVDVRPAKGLSVEKVFEQNAGKFSPIGKGESKIDGAKAPYLVVRPSKDTERRVYFVVKNDKFVRVFLTWYQPMKADYLPVFERAIGTLHIK
jgi:hypothetical protein